MNAPTPAALLEQAAAEPVKASAVDIDAILDGSIMLSSAQRETLKIDEILDATPKGDKGTAITAIAPFAPGLTGEMLALLKATYSGAVFDVKDPAGMKEAKATVSRLTKLKTSMEAAYTEWNAPIQDMLKLARTQRDFAIDSVVALRDPIKAQIDVEQAEIDRIKHEKAAAESRRIEAHVGALTQLQKLPEQYVSAASADIEAQIRDLDSFEYLTRRDWEEYMPAAQDAVRASLDTLKTHLTNAQAREELAKLQSKAAEEQAARDRAAAAEAAERERVEKLRERINNIRLAPTTAIGLPAAQIQRTLDRLNAVNLDEFAEFTTEATEAATGARSNLETMLEAAKDAEELKEFREAKARKEQADREAAERAEREKQEAADAAARAAKAEAERKEREAREEAVRIQREREEAARAARERAEQHAETLLALLIESRTYVADHPAAYEGNLVARIDAAIDAAKGA
jgi:hypothetical protein